MSTHVPVEMIHCRRCGTRFDPELLACPVCKAEVVPPKPEEAKAKSPQKRELALPELPQLPDITVNMALRPSVEGVVTGAVWSDVLLGLLGGMVGPGLVGWSLFSAMSETQFSYLLAFLLLALPIGLEIALFIRLLSRYRSLAIGLGITAFLCAGGLSIIGLLFAASALFMTFRG